ncbi:MAG: ABC transporter ATP-binding protein [Myxococcales bacterium]|nr:ABC transporter ATP-binding protein [Myxococcales bacterium]
MALVLESVGKKLGGEVHLHPLDLTLQPGTMNVLLGHTGAGKTSLLRVLAGLDRPTSGKLLRDGKDVTRATARERSVAMVYQQFINYPSLTVRANIASPLRKRSAAEIAGRVRELAQQLRIEELLDRLPGQLSGGQQQRVAIARALAKGADLLLLDEPLVNLDYKLREELRDELRLLFGAAGASAQAASRAAGHAATVVYATTDPAEALSLGGTTVVLHQGRVLQHAPALQVYHRPASLEAARVGSDPPLNVFAGRVRDGAIELGESLGGAARVPLAGHPHLARLPEGEYQLGLRASDCRLRPQAASDLPVRVQVELREITGSESFVYVRAADTASQLIVHQDGIADCQLDEALTIHLDPRRLLVFAKDGGALVSSYHEGP